VGLVSAPLEIDLISVIRTMSCTKIGLRIKHIRREEERIEGIEGEGERERES
jgi:hypothetical protein